MIWLFIYIKGKNLFTYFWNTGIFLIFFFFTKFVKNDPRKCSNVCEWFYDLDTPTPTNKSWFPSKLKCVNTNYIYQKKNKICPLTYIEPFLCVAVVFAGSGVVVDRYLFRIVHTFRLHPWLVHGEWTSKTSVSGRSGYHGNRSWNITVDFFLHFRIHLCFIK